MTHCDTKIAICYHCGNRVPLLKVDEHHGKELYEHIDGKRFEEDFAYGVYRCPTCDGISIYGDFTYYPRGEIYSRLYPPGNGIVPQPHKVTPNNCVPSRLVRLYEEIWPLRHIAPSAFAGQIRRGLEFICHDQGATGRTLFEKLGHLARRGTFPGYFAEITDLMRRVGNMGAHLAEDDVDFWDAELLDDFFRSIIEYVYIAPAKIARLKQRVERQSTDT